MITTTLTHKQLADIHRNNAELISNMLNSQRSAIITISGLSYRLTPGTDAYTKLKGLLNDIGADHSTSALLLETEGTDINMSDCVITNNSRQD